MKMEYLYHSGVLLENHEVQVFIDSYKDISKVINRDKRIYILASHGHSDHWNNDNIKYYGDNVTFVLSSDITSSMSFKKEIESYKSVFPWKQVVSVEPYEKYELRDINVSTYGSTDLGVSFIIEFDEKQIYHSGDLNWWHWENDSEEAQKKEANDYKTELNKFEFNQFDLAFVPLDPRLNAHCYLAMDYFLDQFGVALLVPIHFGENYSITQGLAKRYSERKVNVVQVDRSNLTINI